MAYSVFRVPNGIAVLPTGAAQVVTTVQGASGQTADLQQWQDYLGNNISRIDNVGNHYGVSGVFTGNMAINGGSITTSAATANLFNSATTLNLGTASTNVFVGSVGTTNVNTLTATGQINANNGTIATNQTTANLLNTTATTINAFGAATTLNIANSALTSGVVNIGTNNTSGTITLGTSSTSTVIAGNLVVNGTTTTVNSNTVSTQDLNINVASNQASLTGINNAGLIAGSGLNVTWYYDSTNASWTSSENINAASTKTYKIAGTDVLSATTLGANIILSSLQKVGTIATGVWQGTSISTTYTDAKVASVAVAGTGLSINASTGAVTITSNATSANTANAIVTRDSGGNFSAGTITATLTGTATQVSNNLSIGSGLATTSATYNGSSAVSVGLAPITQGTNGATFAKITLDAYGRVTATGVVASGDIPSLSASQITAGTLAVAQGGTNLASYAVGDLLYASATTTIAKLAAVASGQFLVSNGVTTAPSYRNLSTPDITGALGYTPANSGNMLSGTGSSGKVALWNGAASLTNDTELAYDSTNNILSIAHGNITASNSVLTIGTTGTDVVDSFTTSSYRTAKYLLQARNSGSTEFQISEVLVVHDGTTAYLTEYGKIYTGANPLLVSLAVTISTGTLSFTATGAAAGTVVRFTKITMNS